VEQSAEIVQHSSFLMLQCTWFLLLICYSRHFCATTESSFKRLAIGHHQLPLPSMEFRAGGVHGGALQPYEERRATHPRDNFGMMDGMMPGMMMPMGGRRGANRPSDPFSMMDDMMAGMMMPFGGRRGGSMMGGGMMGGGLFGQMEQMMAMSSQGGGMMSMSSQGGGGNFSCQTMMVSSQVGQDGQTHTERFASSTVGDSRRNFRETQQAYSNSASGMDKMSMERQLHDQGRKMVKERCRNSGEERQTEMFKGMTEDQTAEFDSRWQREAAPHIPSHNIGQLAVGGRPSASHTVVQHALPSPAVHAASGYPTQSAVQTASGYPRESAGQRRSAPYGTQQYRY